MTATFFFNFNVSSSSTCRLCCLSDKKKNDNFYVFQVLFKYYFSDLLVVAPVIKTFVVDFYLICILFFCLLLFIDLFDFKFVFNNILL